MAFCSLDKAETVERKSGSVRTSPKGEELERTEWSLPALNPPVESTHRTVELEWSTPAVARL